MPDLFLILFLLLYGSISDTRDVSDHAPPVIPPPTARRAPVLIIGRYPNRFT